MAAGSASSTAAIAGETITPPTNRALNARADTVLLKFIDVHLRAMRRWQNYPRLREFEQAGRLR